MPGEKASPAIIAGLGVLNQIPLSYLGILKLDSWGLKSIWVNLGEFLNYFKIWTKYAGYCLCAFSREIVHNPCQIKEIAGTPQIMNH